MVVEKVEDQKKVVGKKEVTDKGVMMEKEVGDEGSKYSSRKWMN